MGNLSALPTDDAIFVEGAFTLLNPTGLSESPTRGKNNYIYFDQLTQTYLIICVTNISVSPARQF